MNDGMSQDPWERVLAASKILAQSGAERFGVALGEEVDLRELEHVKKFYFEIYFN